MKRLAARALLLCAVFMTNGCVLFLKDKVHYGWDGEGATPVGAPASRDDGDFIGLAFSGGGSRAALFAAAGAEALHETGWLSRVTHISSVSGGSFASSYLVTTASAECPVFTPGAAGADCGAYFDSFKTMMRDNYIVPMELRQVTHPMRFLSPTRRIISLQETIDKKFLGKQTFADIDGGPVLLINAASYDDARRFVFSNLPVPDWPAGDEREKEIALENAHNTLWASSFSTEDETYSTPDDFPLSLAVASSAAFPPLLGPVTIKVGDERQPETLEYWHLGDGGILENTGTETLQELIVRKAVSEQAPDRAVIFSFNAGIPNSPEQFKARSNLKLWTTNPGQVVFMSNIRAEAYRDLVWRQIQDQLNIPVAVIEFRYVDAKIGAWPAACKKSARRAETPEAHLHTVPTSLMISKCDAAVVEAAGRAIVEQQFPAARDALAKAGFN